jgi:hypothetical protein
MATPAHSEPMRTRRWQLIEAWPRGHFRAWEPTSGGAIERGEHGDPGSGLTRARVVVERRRDGGDERQGLELGARATEGVRELKRVGKRGGEGQGCSLPFIGLGVRRRWPGLVGLWR